MPEEFQYLLPKSWSEMEAEVNRKGTARYDCERRKMHVIALVGKSEVELTGLIRKIQW